MSACHRVFAVPELVEMILQNLPPKDLLLAQRVETFIKDVVMRSELLQRALFFLPPTPEESTKSQEHIKLNSLLLKRHPWVPSEFDSGPTFFELDPAYFDTPGLESYEYYESADHCCHLHVYGLTTAALSDLETFLDTSVASWLDMHIQLPVVTARVFVACCDDFNVLGTCRWTARADVKSATVRELITVAACLYKAAAQSARLRITRDDKTQWLGLSVACNKLLSSKGTYLVAQEASMFINA